ncbi:alpha/beta hydrolase [Aridibaculum aurantiacum]|uniref:alpha/beta hydrolase n=1 Tax=Aridibaculum aurantiacum TaxID=2810307 RepID=UPI001A966D67|nr:alpha/beta hydrolase [Aridibaculum aurantiacum]
MNKIRFFIVCLLLQFSTNAQQMIIPLWPAGNVPNYQQVNEVEKRDTGSTIHIRNVQEPDIAVFLPAKRNANGMAVVVCPGGGYSNLSYDWEGLDVAKWLNSKGFAAVVLKYRLPNSKSNVVPHLSPLSDAKRALRMVRANAARWNVKVDKIGIMGFSAGGHLASTLGTHFDAGNASAADSVERYTSRPDFMVLVYPVISMSKSIMHAGSKTNLIGSNPTAELAKEYSNELQVTKQTPPTFLIHATDDKTVPVENSLLFFQALKDNAVPAEMHIYPKGGHGFGLALGRGYLETWTDRCTDWLKEINK